MKQKALSKSFLTSTVKYLPLKKKKKEFGADRIQILTKNNCSYSVQAACALTMFKDNNACMTYSTQEEKFLRAAPCPKGKGKRQKKNTAAEGRRLAEEHQELLNWADVVYKIK